MKFDPPILSRGGLSGRVYVITHGTVDPHPNPECAAQGQTLITASRKYDVTDQFDALVAGRSAERAAEMRREVESRMGGRFSDTDREAIDSVLAGILTEHEGTNARAA